MTAWVAGALATAAIGLLGAATGHERRRDRLAELAPQSQLTVSGERPSVRLRLARIRRPGRRTDLIQAQLADTISAIAAATRTGMSLLQAVELAAEQATDPIAIPLRDVVRRIRLGVPLEDSLDGWIGAMPVPDVRLAVGVLRLHRAVGGVLAPTLEGLARTLRERRAAVRELRSLTAQARLSGAILGLLPVGFFGFLWLASRSDMVVAARSPAGRTAIALGLALDLVAFFWIRRLLRVDA